jgi:hypothetical protein
MTLRKISLAFALAALTALPLMAQAVLRNADGSTQTQSQQIAHRLYRALLGRDADPAGLNDTAYDVEHGRTRQRIDAIVASQEFRNHTNGWASDRLVTQIYQGLLDRDPDWPGATNWQRLVEQRKYADALTGIMSSAEFQNKVGSAMSTGMSSTAAAGTADSATAVNCQENVVEAIRNDLTGFVFLQFDAPSINGSTITGSATDVSDGGRRLTYRCDGGTSYNYDDGRRQRSAPAEGDFSNDIVRSCQGEIRTKVQQQRGAANVVFESAGLIQNGDQQVVRGLGFERSNSGSNGANFHYTCDMRGTQIMVSSFRGR